VSFFGVSSTLNTSSVQTLATGFGSKNGFECAGTYSITAGTLPTLILEAKVGVSTGAAQASINTTLTGTSTQGAATLTTTYGAVLTGGAVTTVTNAPWSISGTGQAVNVGAKLGGTGTAGTINVGSYCVFY
jgi:hypothetical protein